MYMPLHTCVLVSGSFLCHADRASFSSFSCIISARCAAMNTLNTSLFSLLCIFVYFICFLFPFSSLVCRLCKRVCAFLYLCWDRVLK